MVHFQLKCYYFGLEDVVSRFSFSLEPFTTPVHFRVDFRMKGQQDDIETGHSLQGEPQILADCTWDELAVGRWPWWLDGLWTEKNSCKAQRQRRIWFRLSVWADLHLVFSPKLCPCSQMKHFFSLSQLFVFFWVLLVLMTQSYKPSLSSGWNRRLTDFRLDWVSGQSGKHCETQS